MLVAVMQPAISSIRAEMAESGCRRGQGLVCGSCSRLRTLTTSARRPEGMHTWTGPCAGYDAEKSATWSQTRAAGDGMAASSWWRVVDGERATRGPRRTWREYGRGAGVFSSALRSPGLRGSASEGCPAAATVQRADEPTRRRPGCRARARGCRRRTERRAAALTCSSAAHPRLLRAAA